MEKKQFQTVPLEQAALICERFNKDQVIILTRNREHCRDTVTTWGTSDHDKDLAAEAGNRLKLAIGWTPKNARAMSARVSALINALEAAKIELTALGSEKSLAYKVITEVLASSQKEEE